jgi:hypothetical protein
MGNPRPPTARVNKLTVPNEVPQSLEGLEQDEQGQPRAGPAGLATGKSDLRRRRRETRHFGGGRIGLQAGVGGVADQGHGGRNSRQSSLCRERRSCARATACRACPRHEKAGEIYCRKPHGDAIEAQERLEDLAEDLRALDLAYDGLKKFTRLTAECAGYIANNIDTIPLTGSGGGTGSRSPPPSWSPRSTW